MPSDLSERDAALLLDMRNAVSDARSFISDLDREAFLASRLHQSAVIRALEVLGEAANKITPATREALPDIPWREMIGMRHRLIHGYDDVRLDIAWTVVSVRLPILFEQLAPIVKTLNYILSAIMNNALRDRFE